MNDLVQQLRDLAHSLGEHPADWPDDLLAEVDNLAAAVKGHAQTERLIRATDAYNQPATAQPLLPVRRRSTRTVTTARTL